MYAAASSSPAGTTNIGTNVTITTPFVSRTRSRTSSGTLRGTPDRARADEWEKITGASLTSIAWRIVSAETWLRSTSTPRRFISRTTSSPNRVSPPCSGSSVAESAHGVLWLCVSVM